MSDEISQEDIDEVVQDRYRIFSLANGQIIIGKIISTTQFGMMIKNPVIADLEDSQINFKRSKN